MRRKLSDSDKVSALLNISQSNEITVNDIRIFQTS